jgi:methylmalonyl-CoA mutase
MNSDEMSEKVFIIPPARVRYLSEISENNRTYANWVKEQAALAQKLFSIQKTIDTLKQETIEDKDRLIKVLEQTYQNLLLRLDPKNKHILENWTLKKRLFQDEYYVFKVRDKELKIKTHSTSLSHNEIPKVAVPKFEAWGEVLHWVLTENFPGVANVGAVIFRSPN